MWGGHPVRQTHPSVSSDPVALKFRFNAWAKYSNWRLDEKIGSLMANVKSPILAAKNAAE